MDGYTLTNIYETLNDMHFFYNYSDIIKSYVSVYREVGTNNIRYEIKSVPLIRYSYITNVDRCLEFINIFNIKSIYR